jgi:hypothetical protein
MPDLRRQISDPRDRDEMASSRGGAGEGEAWMRICRRLRAELGEEVYVLQLQRVLPKGGLCDRSGNSRGSLRLLPRLQAYWPSCASGGARDVETRLCDAIGREKWIGRLSAKFEMHLGMMPG